MGLLVTSPLTAETNPALMSTDEEVEVHRFPAEGGKLLLIAPSSHGITKGLIALSEGLSQLGVEVWVADPFATWFLPEGASSLNKIPPAAYAGLITKARNHASAAGKEFYLLAFDRGTRRLLEAARQWQTRHQASVLDGVILVSPDLYGKTPAAGDTGIFLPIAKATNLPVFLFDTEKSTLSLRLPDTIAALEYGGSDVFVKVLHGVRNRFFFRPDATAQEQAMTTDFPAMITQAMRLTRLYAKSRTAAPISRQKVAAQTSVNTGKLLPYRGTLKAQDFEREDLSGKQHSLSDYRGQVVLLNFWASWCPPCVHEMPSMSQLNITMDNKPFTILAVNLGESRGDIGQFVKKHPVNFPILLDPGQSLPKVWKVFAFPTSFILDKLGRIRYSVAGGIDWNEKSVRDVIEGLTRETTL